MDPEFSGHAFWNPNSHNSKADIIINKNGNRIGISIKSGSILKQYLIKIVYSPARTH
jgi:hypothetical protein